MTVALRRAAGTGDGPGAEQERPVVELVRTPAPRPDGVGAGVGADDLRALPRRDRTGAARRVLESQPHLSDRAVADITGLAARTIAALRHRIPAGASAEARVCRDGRTRPLSTANGRRAAGRLLSQQPELSLRKVAERTGLSVGTVRDVRKRLSQGHDPVPPRQRRMEARHLLPTDPGCGRGDGSDHDVPPTGLSQAEAVSPPRCTDPPEPDYGTLLARLGADPALRFSTAGRATLRLLSQAPHLPAEHCAALARSVPPHCAPAIGSLARQRAEMWLRLAGAMADRADTP